jgi:hypothetical protein
VSIRLYIDEDSMSRALARALRARNVDVTTALEQDMIERSDSAHLDYETAQGRVLFSFNVGDFCRLHNEYLTQGKPHAGIIVSPQQRFSVGEQMRRLLRLSADRSAEQMYNNIEFLGQWG